MKIEVHENPNLKPLPEGPLVFGTQFGDHMIRMHYTDGAWETPQLIPFEPLSLSPAAAVLHYAQAMFEGLKAYSCPDGKIRLFRPDMNAARMNRSGARLCMPALPEGAFEALVEAIVKKEARWIPKEEGASLYVRPVMFATEPFLGVRPSKEYDFLIMVGPVAAYYASGFSPVRIWIETEEVRAAPGGVGAAKFAGNYAASLHAAEKAKERGYSQVLWTDAVSHEYIEEVGTMNLFAVLDDEIVTPPLDGSLLPGVTRDSVLHLLRDKGEPVSERPLSVVELRKAHEQGRLREVFGTGTAAVISPVGVLGSAEGEMTIGDGGVGPIARMLEAEITGMQRGTVKDRFGWVRVLD